MAESYDLCRDGPRLGTGATGGRRGLTATSGSRFGIHVEMKPDALELLAKSKEFSPVRLTTQLARRKAWRTFRYPPFAPLRAFSPPKLN